MAGVGSIVIWFILLGWNARSRIDELRGFKLPGQKSNSGIWSWPYSPQGHPPPKPSPSWDGNGTGAQLPALLVGTEWGLRRAANVTEGPHAIPRDKIQLRAGWRKGSPREVIFIHSLDKHLRDTHMYIHGEFQGTLTDTLHSLARTHMIIQAHTLPKRPTHSFLHGLTGTPLHIHTHAHGTHTDTCGQTHAHRHGSSCTHTPMCSHIRTVTDAHVSPRPPSPTRSPAPSH